MTEQQHGLRALALALSLATLGALAACGPSAASTPRGAPPGREGASSGGMSTVRASEVPTHSGGSYPTEIIAARAAPESSANEGEARALQPLQFDQTVAGALRQGDNVVDDGRLADEYVFFAPEGTAVTIELNGGELTGHPGSHIDMYLYLYRDGQLIAQDDDGGGDLNSRIQTTLTVAGMYTVRATTFGAGPHEGSYTLTLRRGAVSE